LRWCGAIVGRLIGYVPCLGHKKGSVLELFFCDRSPMRYLSLFCDRVRRTWYWEKCLNKLTSQCEKCCNVYSITISCGL